MRWLLPALSLLLAPVPDDAQARELYSALRKKFETAQTVSVDFSMNVTVRTRTFIVSENNTIFWKDTQGEPVLEWPSDEDLAAEWKKLD
jgi:hypothetical protein